MFAADELERKKEDLISVIKSGRLPISPGNVQLIPVDAESSAREIISRNSIDADLTIVGFRNELIRAEGINMFIGYENLGNILFVSSTEKKEIS